MTLIANNPLITKGVSQQVSFDEFKVEVLNDYKLACISREASLTGRKEVLTGKAKFGIFGLGVKYSFFALDFAYLASLSQNHPLQNTLRFSLSFAFDPDGNR